MTLKMKTILVLILSLVPIFGLQAQQKVDGDKESCHHCKMLIKDELHAAQIINTDNKVLKFDSVECLVNNISFNDKYDYKEIYVSDYGNSGELISAENAFYLKSDAIKSPMGANLSAFNSKKEAEKHKNSKEDKIYNWDQLTETFKNSPRSNAHSHQGHSRPDAYAPTGVMGDHLHHKGGFMLSLRYMNMRMEGNKAGTKQITNAGIFDKYLVAPQEMEMQMYMLGIMYAPNNNLTLVAMQGFVRNNMDLTTNMLMNGMMMQQDFSTRSSGFGDLKLNVLYGIYNKNNKSLHLNTGISLPIASISERDNTPMMQNAKLPYPMQLGSGTLDLTAGATYKEMYPSFSWGSQLLGIFRTGENSEEYRLGDLYQLNLWGAMPLLENLSLSGRALGIITENIHGKDPELNSSMVPTADPDNYGGEKINLYGGMNLSFNQSSFLKNFRWGVEVGVPVYENYHGIQMNENMSFVIGLKYTSM